MAAARHKQIAQQARTRRIGNGRCGQGQSSRPVLERRALPSGQREGGPPETWVKTLGDWLGTLQHPGASIRLTTGNSPWGELLTVGLILPEGRRAPSAEPMVGSPGFAAFRADWLGRYQPGYQ